MKRIVLLLIVCFCALPAALWSQNEPKDTAQLYVVTKLDGTEYIGKILLDDGREVLIETQALGKIYIPKSEIRSIVKIEDTNKDITYGEYSGTGPFTTRYCFTTNALPIRKGQNYALINLYGPEVHFAVSDNFSLGLMSTWIGSPLVLAGKYSFTTKNERINFSLGTLAGTSGYLNQFRGFGALHFGNITIGDRKNNISFSAGYGYAKTGSEYFLPYQEPGSYTDTLMYWPEDKYQFDRPLVKGPIISIAGIAKVGAKASFIFDSMFGIFSSEVTDSQTTMVAGPNVWGNPSVYHTVITQEKRTTYALFLMPAMRFQSTERKAFQIALAGVVSINKDDTYSFPLPMCTWFYRF